MSTNRQTQIMEQEQESLTGYKATISSDHAYIHDGIAFIALVNTGSISAAYDIAFTTPAATDGKFIHWRPIGFTTSANYIYWELTEGETASSGTTVTPINRNRLSSNTSKMSYFAKGATCTPAGTIIDLGGVGSAGNPASRSGGGAGGDEEIVLKQNTTYCLTITPAGATTVTGKLFWYEESKGLDEE